MGKLRKVNHKLIATVGSLLFFAVIGAFATKPFVANTSKQSNSKAAIIEKIGRLPEVPINFDNSIGSPLTVETASVKVISGTEYAYLTGDPAKVSSYSTFPKVIVTNNSGRKITRWSLMIKSAADSPDAFRGVMYDDRPLSPGGSCTVESTYFLAVVRTTVVKDGRSIPVAKVPGYDSASRWLPGSAGDLKVINNVADFEGGERWTMPKSYKFFN